MKLNLTRTRSVGTVYVTDQCELEYADDGTKHTCVVEEIPSANVLDHELRAHALEHNLILPSRNVTISFPLIETVMEKFFLLTGDGECGDCETPHQVIHERLNENDIKEAVESAVESISPPKCDHSIVGSYIQQNDFIFSARCSLCSEQLSDLEVRKLIREIAQEC